jgi:uncharacterized protein YgiM (DUF1202 family)
MRKLVLYTIVLTALCLCSADCASNTTLTAVATPTAAIKVSLFAVKQMIVGEEIAFYVEVEPQSVREQVSNVKVSGDKGIQCEPSEVDPMWTWYCTGTQESKAATVFAEVTGTFPDQMARYPVEVVAPTPAPTGTPTPTPTQPPVTETPTLTDTLAPRLTEPSVTDTPTPTGIPIPQADAVVNATPLNLRAGPGTQYGIVGQLSEGDALTVTGKNNEAGDWLQVVTTDEIEGWVSSQFVILYVDGVPIVPTPAPPPTQAAPPSPQYSFESGTMGWVPQRDASDTKAVTAVAQSSGQTRSGRPSLELTVDLIGGNHQTNSKGEAFVDMGYNLPSGITTPAPYDLTGKTITCWMYAPLGSAGDPGSPNGFQVFVKDTGFKSEYGSWENITPQREGTWFPITLTPSTQMPPGGYKDPEFNPTRIILLGVKIGAGGQSTDQIRYAGSTYVDTCDW